MFHCFNSEYLKRKRAGGGLEKELETYMDSAGFMGSFMVLFDHIRVHFVGIQLTELQPQSTHGGVFYHDRSLNNIGELHIGTLRPWLPCP